MEQVRTDFNQTFGSEHGQRVLTDLLNFCGLLEPANPDDGPNAVMLSAGRRDVALFILNNMNIKNISEIISG